MCGTVYVCGDSNPAIENTGCYVIDYCGRWVKNLRVLLDQVVQHSIHCSQSNAHKQSMSMKTLSHPITMQFTQTSNLNP